MGEYSRKNLISRQSARLLNTELTPVMEKISLNIRKSLPRCLNDNNFYEICSQPITPLQKAFCFAVNRKIFAHKAIMSFLRKITLHDITDATLNAASQMLKNEQRIYENDAVKKFFTSLFQEYGENFIPTSFNEIPATIFVGLSLLSNKKFREAIKNNDISGFLGFFNKDVPAILNTNDDIWGNSAINALIVILITIENIQHEGNITYYQQQLTERKKDRIDPDLASFFGIDNNKQISGLEGDPYLTKIFLLARVPFESMGVMPESLHNSMFFARIREGHETTYGFIVPTNGYNFGGNRMNSRLTAEVNNLRRTPYFCQDCSCFISCLLPRYLPYDTATTSLIHTLKQLIYDRANQAPLMQTTQARKDITALLGVLMIDDNSYCFKQLRQILPIFPRWLKWLRDTLRGGEELQEEDVETIKKIFDKTILSALLSYTDEILLFDDADHEEIRNFWENNRHKNTVLLLISDYSVDKEKNFGEQSGGHVGIVADIIKKDGLTAVAFYAYSRDLEVARKADVPDSEKYNRGYDGLAMDARAQEPGNPRREICLLSVRSLEQ